MAPYIGWMDAYLVGVSRFDEDHRQLAAIADGLIAAIEEGEPHPALCDRLDDLIEGVVAHFEGEESAMRDLDYPRYLAHREAHNTLLRAIVLFKRDLRRRCLQAEEATEFIFDWLMMHIKDEDMLYTRHFHARGLR